MMKKSLALLISLCVALCLTITSCAEIPSRDTTGTESAFRQSVETTAKQQENPGAAASADKKPAEGTNGNENVTSTPNDSGTEQSVQGVVFLHTEEDVDLTNAVLNVYKKINIVVSGGFTSYSTEYIGSAYSDADGKIIYEKPDVPFVIELDLSTLPSGMGVKKRYFSYNDGTSEEALTVELHRVVSAEAYFASHDLNFIFKNSDNENVLVHYEEESRHAVNRGSPSAAPEALAVQYRGNIDCTLTYSGNVSINGVLFPYSADQSHSRLDYADYVSLLYGAKLITEAEKTDMLEKFYETEYGKAYPQGGGCCLPG